MKRIMAAPGLPEAQGPYAMATVANGFVFVSGQGPYDPKTNAFAEGASIEEQTRLTIEAIGAVLKEAGTSLENAVQCRVFMEDVKRDFAAMNAVYAKYFGQNKPARTTVQASPPINILIEIDCVAVLPEQA